MSTPIDWDQRMKAQLQELQDCILATGIVASQVACSETERQRLELCLSEIRSGKDLPPNLEQLRVDILQMTRDAAKYAQAIVARAAAAPDDRRRGFG